MSAPKYRLEEIIRLTGISGRSIRHYVGLDLLPGAEPRGVATVYTHEQLVRLKAIPLLRKRERLRLSGVKRRLDAMTLEEIEALVTPPAPPAPPPSPAPKEGPPAETATYPSTRWEHVELLPGLELRVRVDSGVLVKRLAQEIFAKYAAAAPPATNTSAPEKETG